MNIIIRNLKPKKAVKLAGGLLIVMTAICLEPYNMIDGVTAASVLHPTAQPKLVLSATPGITNNAIVAKPGQAITVNLTGSDPNGFNSYVFVGLVQGGYLYPPNTPGISLPNGASFNSVNGSNEQAVFTWTPPASQAGALPSTITFGVYNTYGNGNSNVKSINFSVVETGTPTFAASTPTQETVYVGLTSQMQVVVNPDTDKDNVIISSNDLPNGATLSTAAKNANGQWVSTLTWTPTAAELGTTSITFNAVDKNETASKSLTTNFTVKSNAIPSFAATLPTTKNAVAGKILTFNVIVIPDSYTHDVKITPTGLPTTAKLSKPVFHKAKNQVIATLTWKPTKAEINQSFPVTFTAEDNIANAQSVTYDVTFKVVAK